MRLSTAITGVVVYANALSLSAATLDVLITDDQGRPLADAVVFLESHEAKRSVKPIAGVEIAQRGKQFDPRITVVPIGTPVSFPNHDTVRHHVYSFSPAKKFEIKLYVGRPESPIVFDKPGVATLGCNIHDQMVAWVVIVETPYYGQTGADGKLTLPDVSAGSYSLRAWHASLREGAALTEQSLTIGVAATQARLAVKGAVP
jgi:plastocyanin